MKSNKRLLLILLVPLTELMKWVAVNNAEWVEHFYSRGIYPYIAKTLSTISGIFPFSVMELIILSLMLLLIYKFFKIIMAIKKKQFISKSIHFLSSIVLFASFTYFLFFVLWSLNNYRQDVDEIFEFDGSMEVTIHEVEQLYERIIIKTNALREQLPENKEGIPDITSVRYITNNAQKSYEQLANYYPLFRGNYGRAKPLAISRYQTLSGYTGIYFPFTGEPNINKEAPIFSIPHTTCHEIAHQRGFAQEDSANYVGFLACKYSDDLFFQYSGYLFSLSVIRNTLYKHAPEIAQQHDVKLSLAVKGDLKYKNTFWTRNENKQLSKITDQANSAYLKSNNQEEGLANYSKVVDLLIADFRKNGDI